MKVVCGILIWNDKVLIGKRKLTNEHQPGKWEFPGGKLEPNETLEECLHREWKEELNLEIEIYSLLTTVKSENMIIHYYIGKILDNQQIKVNVHQCIAFFYPGVMHNLSLFDGDDKIVDLILDTSAKCKKIDEMI